jgi:hypothetical protein
MIRTLASVMLALSPLVALPAAAQSSGSLTVVCAASQREGFVTTCDGHADVTLSVADRPGSMWSIRLTAPASHCSPVTYMVVRPPFATGADVVGMTRVLRAGETDYVALGDSFGPGRYPFRIVAGGYVEGCNIGQMHSWGVDYAFVLIPR